MDAEDQLSPAARLQVFSRAKGVCCLCGRRIEGPREKWVVVRRRPDALPNDVVAHSNCASPSQEEGQDECAEKPRRETTVHKRSLPYGRKSTFKRKITGEIVP